MSDRGAKRIASTSLRRRDRAGLSDLRWGCVARGPRSRALSWSSALLLSTLVAVEVESSTALPGLREQTRREEVAARTSLNWHFSPGARPLLHDWTTSTTFDFDFEQILNDSVTLRTAAGAQHPESLKTLRGVAARGRRLRTLGFAPKGTPEWSRGTAPPPPAPSAALADAAFFGRFASSPSPPSPAGGAAPPARRAVHSRSRYSFASYVGRWRVAVAADPADDGARRPPPPQDGDNSDGDDGTPPQQPRELSDGAISEIERQLNKEPSISYGNDDVDPPPLTAAETEAVSPSTEGGGAAAEQKPFVQYEIHCHILFRDTSTFPSHAVHSYSYGSGAHHPAHHPANGNVQHHSWSVWKRYSELQAMDEELRRDFGWQLDALDDGRGVAFPSAHGLESWWYKFRHRGRSGEDGTEEGGGLVGWGASGMSAWFGAGDAAGEGRAGDDGNDGDDGLCPYPAAFLDKRQRELSSYWTNLMRVEDIFEFGDVRSHKFGKAMAAFLGVDRVLRARQDAPAGAASSVNGPPTRPPSAATPHTAFPAIDENATADAAPAFGPAPLPPPSSFASSASSPDDAPALEVPDRLATYDDDVSILSDGTSNAMGGVSQRMRGVPVRGGQPAVVDIVPRQHSNDSVGGDGKNQGGRSQRRKARATASTAPRAKPAFQRQFLLP